MEPTTADILIRSRQTILDSLDERGYDVTIVSDCTSGRSATEHEFYCQSVFPLYGAARASEDLLAAMN